MSPPPQVAEPSLEELQLDRKESEVEASPAPRRRGAGLRAEPECVCVSVQEAKAIIAQRSDNPREFFKNRERAMTSSMDASPVTLQRTGEGGRGVERRRG